MSTPEIEKENAYYRALAQFEEVDKIRLGLHGFTSDQFQERYLELWKHFLAEHPHYLYPDDLSLPYDMLWDEYVPHPEGSTAQSYPNVERLLVEAREERAAGLARHYGQMRQNGSPRQVLAERLLNMAALLEKHTVLQELSGNRHKAELATSTADGSEPPQQVGWMLADLAHFLEVHEAFLAAEGNAAIQTHSKAGTSRKIQTENSQTLESICNGLTDKRREELAKMIDAIWQNEKKNITDADNLPAGITAVYKLAVWLGLIKQGVISHDWKRVLALRYEVTVSEGIGKYTIEKAVSGVFRNSVKRSFGFIKQQYPRLSKSKDLPDIYR